MSWRCGVCTYLHQDPTECEYLICKICLAERKGPSTQAFGPCKQNTTAENKTLSRKKRPLNLENLSSRPRKRNINDFLTGKKASDFVPSPKVRIDGEWHIVAENKLHLHAPLSLTCDVLPSTLARQLLDELERKITWRSTSWNIAGNSFVVKRKTSCVLLKDDTQITETEFGMNLEGASSTMKSAASAIQKLMNYIRPQIHWKPSYALGNRYNDGTETVGFHSDHLVEIGPRPVIIGLTLGSARRFDMKRSKQSCGTCDYVQIYLPHNSAVIMWDDAQENWQHSVPRCSSDNIIRHRVTGLVRYSLTFRMKRDDIPRLENCNCGVEAGLKSKDGKYYMFCKPYNKERCCKFWKRCSWAEKEAARLRSL